MEGPSPRKPSTGELCGWRSHLLAPSPPQAESRATLSTGRGKGGCWGGGRERTGLKWEGCRPTPVDVCPGGAGGPWAGLHPWALLGPLLPKPGPPLTGQRWGPGADCPVPASPIPTALETAGHSQRERSRNGPSQGDSELGQSQHRAACVAHPCRPGPGLPLPRGSRPVPGHHPGSSLHPPRPEPPRGLCKQPARSGMSQGLLRSLLAAS